MPKTRRVKARAADMLLRAMVALVVIVGMTVILTVIFTITFTMIGWPTLMGGLLHWMGEAIRPLQDREFLLKAVSWGIGFLAAVGLVVLGVALIERYVNQHPNPGGFEED